METQSRKILFLSCFFAFIILCPIILAYSIGFKFDFNNKKIVPTGSISIKSIPKKSKIYINNKLCGAETPAYVNNLPEGEYNIKISKNGFSKWEKILNVKNYQITIVDNVLLLPQNPKIQHIFNKDIQKIEFSPSKKKAIILASPQTNLNLYLLDLSISQFPIVSRVDSGHKLVSIDQTSLQWSKNEDKISLFGTINNGQKGYFLLPFNSDPIFLTKKQNLSNPISMWHRENNDIFTFLNNTKIYQLNTSNKASVELASDALNYIVIGNKTFFIQKNSGMIYNVSDPWTTLSPELKFTSQFTKTPIPSFSKQKQYSMFILSDKNKEILIQDQSNNLFIASNQEIKQIAEKISGFNVSPSKNKILLYSNHEINILDKNLEYHPKELIARTEQTIKKALWFDDFHIAYLLSDGNFYITELDNRNGRNTLTPVPDKIDDFWIDSSANKNFPIMYYIKENQLFMIDWNNTGN